MNPQEMDSKGSFTSDEEGSYADFPETCQLMYYQCVTSQGKIKTFKMLGSHRKRKFKTAKDLQ